MPVSTSWKKFCTLCALSLSVFLTCLTVPSTALAQTELAGVYGRVTDPSGAVIVDAEVEIKNVETNVSVTVKTNQDGLYTIPSLHPGHYLINVRRPGFKSVTVTELTLNVQDNVVRNFALQVGSVAETVTITADDLHINTTDAAVSTVVDRQFAENLPLNGRSFQTLIQLTPGVVLTTSNAYDSGQFSVNGQRATTNYWMVDGVGANIGVGSGNVPGNGIGGALGSFTVQGGTNSLVSVDALQEFRIQTSTYAPEFGRTPGAQISIITRSGTNQFHGTVFDYLRNDVFDANDWFNTSVTPALHKAQERQNDFGGTFSGPILKGKTFFFFSYEGLRLRLPQTVLSSVPDLNARQNAVPAVQPFINAFPQPNGSANAATGVAQFNASFSNPATLDAYSLRLDHKFNDKVSIFGRYNYSPSELDQRGAPATALSAVELSRITTQTATVGTTWAVSPFVANDLRLNYSRTSAVTDARLDNFGGATPLGSLPFPSAFSGGNVGFFYFIISLQNGLRVGNQGGHNIQRQFNIVDNLSRQHGSHSLKFGVDFRRLSPVSDLPVYSQNDFFLRVPSAAAGQLLFSVVSSGRSAQPLFRNLGAFAQDTWRATPRLTLTYGLRWDIDFAPSTTSGPNIPAVTGFNLNDLSNLALATAGTPPFSTPYGTFAPRFGGAYALRASEGWQTVVRGGVGLFYDLASSEVGNIVSLHAYPFGASRFAFGGSFPLSSAAATPPAIVAPGSGSGTVTAFDPNLKLPYTLQWTAALEQALGKQQAVSASYIGSLGRRLIQTAFVFSPNPSFAQAYLISNAGTSDYSALQIQFQRRLSHGIQALASYTWSHSIDTASAGSALGSSANALVPAVNPNVNRGPSDFDIRHAASAGLTYEIPIAGNAPGIVRGVLRGWSIQSVIQGRSAPPVNVDDSSLFFPTVTTDIRPDLVPGIPLYLYGAQFPGGKAINNTPNQGGPGCFGPFCPPPTDPMTGVPLRQGSLPRNFLRGFGAVQWDFGIHRDFPLRESLKLQFRAETFNVLNHPNFGSPIGDISNPLFGLSTQMLGRSLGGGNLGSGGLSPLYQIGGPRSIQLALKLQF